MSSDSAQPRTTIIDRIFLFGLRQLLISVAIIAAGVYFIADGLVNGIVLDTVSGIILLALGAGMLYGFKTTGTKRITKKYYSMQTLVGKEGTAKLSFSPGTRGTVMVENEYWSALSDEEIEEGDSISVTGVEQDKVTLRVRKK